MANLFEKLGQWSLLAQRLDDDFYDRLSYQYSTGLLIAASIITGGRQLMAERIRCWCPSEMTYHQSYYVNDYCYVAHTYYVPEQYHLPGPGEPRRRKINYYQWVTLFILVQAIMFILPKIIWRFICNSDGYYVSQVAEVLNAVSVCKAESTDGEKRKTLFKSVVFYTDRYLASKETGLCCKRNPHLGRILLGIYVTAAYTFVKLLYLANSLGQIFLINKFLGESGYVMWGAAVAGEFLKTGVAKLSDIFPIVTMCDVPVRAMGDNMHTYTIQCVLPVNIFHDRVYLLMWLWLCFVSIMTVIGIIKWLQVNIMKRSFVLHHLRMKGRCYTESDKVMLTDFLDNYIGTYGLFLLRTIHGNSTCIEFDEFLVCIWDFFKECRSRSRYQRDIVPETVFSCSDHHKANSKVVTDEAYADSHGDLVVTF